MFDPGGRHPCMRTLNSSSETVPSWSVSNIVSTRCLSSSSSNTILSAHCHTATAAASATAAEQASQPGYLPRHARWPMGCGHSRPGPSHPMS
eukprot:COSAG01_NODE_35_length_34814_cov_128.883624_11_plen_92_part_00